MKAVRVHEYKKDPSIDDIPEPKLQGPLDVIVKIGGAGVCRTDLHIIERGLGGDPEPVAALRDRPRERRLGARGRRRRHQRQGRRHGHPPPAAVLRAVPRLPGGPGHAVHRGRVLPGPVEQRRRHGRVPAHHRPGLREAEPGHQPGRRRRAGRRRDHRVPRGAQGRAAALPGHHGRRASGPAASATSPSRRSPRSPPRRSSWWTRTRTPSSSPSRSARTRRSSPTATRSPRCRSSPAAAPPSSSTSSPSRASSSRPGR